MHVESNTHYNLSVNRKAEIDERRDKKQSILNRLNEDWVNAKSQLVSLGYPSKKGKLSEPDHNLLVPEEESKDTSIQSNQDVENILSQSKGKSARSSLNSKARDQEILQWEIAKFLLVKNIPFSITADFVQLVNNLSHKMPFEVSPGIQL